MDFTEIEAEWWLPDYPNNTVRGKLEIKDDNRIMLNLNGMLNLVELLNRIELDGGIRRETLSVFSNYRIILGKTSNNEKVTLFNSFNHETSIGSNVQQMIDVLFMFWGEHFYSEDQICFKEISIVFSGLNTWAKLISFAEEDIKTIDIDDDIVISIISSTNREVSGQKISPYIASNDVYIKISTPESKKFYDLLDYSNRMRQFFAFCMDYPTRICSLIGVTDNQNSVKIFFQNMSADSPNSGNLKYMLLVYTDIISRIEEYVKDYFNKYNTIMKLISLYLLDLYYPEMIDEYKYLSYMHAFEGFWHNLSLNEAGERSDIYISEDNYEILKNRFSRYISNMVENNDLKNKLKSAIKYGNSHSLRKRFKDFLRFYNFINMFFEGKFVGYRRDVFINKVVQTRNYYTHWDEDIEDFAEGEELVWLTRKVKLLMQMCFMKEIGLDEQDIVNIVDRYNTMGKYNLIYDR